MTMNKYGGGKSQPEDLQRLKKLLLHSGAEVGYAMSSCPRERLLFGGAPLGVVLSADGGF
jgi:hypothetical protein